jgi:hypothetical protein
VISQCCLHVKNFWNCGYGNHFTFLTALAILLSVTCWKLSIHLELGALTHNTKPFKKEIQGALKYSNNADLDKLLVLSASTEKIRIYTYIMTEAIINSVPKLI